MRGVRVAVFRFQLCILRTVDQFVIAFLEHLGIGSHAAVLGTVFFYFVNEEQRQHFNSAAV